MLKVKQKTGSLLKEKNIERSVFKSPAKLVLDAYQYKDANQFLVNQVKRFLSESE